jgi:hypothetical protein
VEIGVAAIAGGGDDTAAPDATVLGLDREAAKIVTKTDEK